jgi:hypothetical protein
MNRSALERAVASATGESRRTVRRYGFSLVPDEPTAPDTTAHLGLDCPGCGAEIALPKRNAELPELTECSRCDGAYPFAPHELYLAAALDEAVLACT